MAGRTALLRLLPLSLREIRDAHIKYPLEEIILKGGYPKIYIEIKSSKTFSPSYLDGLRYFHQQSPLKAKGGALIYGGKEIQKLGSFELFNGENCTELMRLNTKF